MRVSMPCLLAHLSTPKAWVWLAFACCALPLKAQNWPQFRGPNAGGTSDMAAPVAWNVERRENIRWKTPIPGLAHASPIIWENRVYVTTAVKPGAKPELKVGLYGNIGSFTENEPHQWRVLSIDKGSGKVLWDKLGHEAVPRVKRHTKASHCNSTPTTDGKHIVAVFGSEGLFGFNMAGERLWHVDLGKMDSAFFESPTAEWGFASSPVLHAARVVVQCDVLSEQFLAVFDAESGRQLWRVPRKDVPTWSTPTLSTAGRSQIVVNGWKHIAGYDFDTGRELWRLAGGGDIPVPTPVVAHGMVYLTSAHGKFRPIRAVRLDAKGDITPPEIGDTNQAIAWSHPRLGSYMQTPIIIGSLLLSCDWNGVLTCLDARSGALHFSERLSGGRQGFSASPVGAGGKVYFTAESGDVFVVAPETKLTVIATNQLGDVCLSTPAMSDGTLFFRTREHLMAIGKNEP